MLGHRSFGAITRCPLCGSHYPASYGGICRSCQGQSPYEDGPGFALSQQPRMPAPVPIPVEEAVGKHALHDMTQIIPGKEKGAAFVAGQELSAGDICRLQQMGKNRVYVQENTPHPEGWVHEDDAARGFARLMPGDGVEVEAAPREGKVNFRATRDGMLLVDTERLERFNLVPDVMCCTRHNYSVLTAGTRLAGSRAIPLFLSRPGFLKALSVLEDGPLFKVVPMRKAKIGILVTGTEVFQGLIEDRFAPIITQKAQQHHCEVVKTLFAPDDADLIVRGVRDLLDAGADFIVTTAGMSVDPDDLTRKGLTEAGLTDTLYGSSACPRVRCSSRPPFSTSSCPVCSPVCPSPASISPRSATAACAWNAKSARSPSAPSGKSDTRPQSMKGSLSSESASLFYANRASALLQ